VTERFDLVVIGTGTAAAAVAYKCRSAGWEVAVGDSRPYGGTCALRGCDPKKVLIGAAELIDWNNRMAGNGVVAQGARIDWPSLMRFKNTFTEPVPKNREKGYAKAGIGMFHGTARFTGEDTVEVDGDELKAQHIVIATGARPATLAIPGEEHLTTSDGFLDLERLPKRIVFVGGGYISFEFAHIAARAGSQVSILHKDSRPLKGFDPDLVGRLLQATKEIGVDVRLNTLVEGVTKEPQSLVIHCSENSSIDTLEADMVVHGAGRVPNIDELELANAGVESDKRGVAVNEYLQSASNSAVYAAGDAAASGGAPLTPVAAMEGHTVASNLLKGNHRKPDYSGIPTVVFTTPPLASVGIEEETAKERGLKFRTNYNKDTSSWFSSRRIGVKHSGFKVLIEEESNRILGAHIFGPHAEEMINIFALAIRTGLPATELKLMPYAYPTSSSDISYMV